LDPADRSAKSISEFIVSTYSFYSGADGLEKTMDDIDLVAAFTLDNCNTNKKMTRLLEKPMIGAFCHRLNLACLSWTRDAYDGNLQTALNQIHAIMKLSGTGINRSKLKQISCPYQPCTKNATRWQGNANMMIQYQKMEPFLITSKICNDAEPVEIEDGASKGNKKVHPKLLIGREKEAFINSYLPAMENLKKWLSVIQSPTMTMQTARDLFKSAQHDKTLINQSQDFYDRLAPNHKLVSCPAFENGVYKIMTGQRLEREEYEACECLKLKEFPLVYLPEDTEEDDVTAVLETNSPTSFSRALQLNAKRKHLAVWPSEYVDCEFLSPTTVVVERLFSACGRVMTADRNSMHPSLFEAIVLLHHNKSWWDVTLVQEMLSKKWDQKLNATYDDQDFDTGGPGGEW